MEAEALLNHYGWTRHSFDELEYRRCDLWVPTVEDTKGIYVLTDRTDMDSPVCYRFVKADGVDEAMSCYDETVPFYVSPHKLEIVLSSLV